MPPTTRAGGSGSAPLNTQEREVATRWADPAAKEQWYEGGMKYWTECEASNNGVLGGFEKVHDADTADTLRFVQKLSERFPDVVATRDPGRPAPGTRAIDMGAGVGRVTEAVLLDLCEKVDLLEGARPLIEAAQRNLKARATRMGEFMCAPMQSFAPEPATYHLIWFQWVIGSLTDDDLVALLMRCRTALAPGGIIVVKDNICEEDPDKHSRYIVDDEDNSVMRTKAYLEQILVSRCGLTILYQTKAKLRCEELHPVQTYALR